MNDKHDQEDVRVLALTGVTTYQGKVDRHLTPLAKITKAVDIVCSKVIASERNATPSNISFTQSPTNIHLLSIILELIVALKMNYNRDYDVIICISLFPRGIYGLILGRIFDIPVHLRIIGSDIPVHSRSWYRVIPIILFARFSSISVHGTGHKEFLIQCGVDSNKIHILPGSIDIDSYEQSQHQESKYDFIWVGGMNSLKKPDLFADAMANLKNNGVDFRAVMVGDGPKRSVVEQIIIENELQDYIDFAGWVDVNEVPEYYSESDIYVMTSQVEGFGFPLVEAMASGLVCVAPLFSDPANGNTHDIIEDGADGLLVQNMNARNLTDTLLSIYDEDETKANLSKKARKSSQRFSQDEMAMGWRDIIQSHTDASV